MRNLYKRLIGQAYEILLESAQGKQQKAIADVQERFDLPLSITQIDFESGKIISTGPNVAINSSTKPLLVKSSGALNNKKVLWLRDSFGNSLSPLMAATFSDVMQLHWSEALKPGGSFARLVQDWQPDYVFVTVVERNARAAVFTSCRRQVL